MVLWLFSLDILWTPEIWRDPWVDLLTLPTPVYGLCMQLALFPTVWVWMSLAYRVLVKTQGVHERLNGRQVNWNWWHWVRKRSFSLSASWIVGNFKSTDSVLKTMSRLASHLQWDIRFATWLNPIKSLWRGSSESNIRFVPHGRQAHWGYNRNAVGQVATWWKK